jgi:hypothetical protein
LQAALTVVGIGGNFPNGDGGKMHKLFLTSILPEFDCGINPAVHKGEKRKEF